MWVLVKCALQPPDSGIDIHLLVCNEPAQAQRMRGVRIESEGHACVLVGFLQVSFIQTGRNIVVLEVDVP